MEVSGQFLDAAGLPSRKEPAVAIGQKAGWPIEAVAKIKFPAPTGNRTPLLQLVGTILTELFRLLLVSNNVE
jgi:hypothetical protein